MWRKLKNWLTRLLTRSTPERTVRTADADCSADTGAGSAPSSLPPPASEAPGGAPAPAEPRPAPRPSATIFGIDFGTTYTSIGVVTQGHLRVLKDGGGATMFPSVVCSPSPDKYLVGWEGRDQAPNHPNTTFYSPKRLIGRRYDDRRIEPVLASMAVPLRTGPDGQLVADLHGQPMAMPQVCAEIFRHAARIGEQATGERVGRVVLSAPVEYKKERQAIRRAAELAGLEVISIVDEPIAAAIGCGLGRQAGLVAVYDFGGGTFDCTLLDVEGGKFRILAKSGDAWLGGDDFDLALTEHAARAFWRQWKVDLHKRRVEWHRLQNACEEAKRRLSEQDSVTLDVPELALLASGKADLHMTLDRTLLGQLCAPLVERSIETLGSCLQEAGIEPQKVSHVAMTGGVSRMPLVREHVQRYFQREVKLAVDPQHAVVIGDSIYAHYLVAQTAAAPE